MGRLVWNGERIKTRVREAAAAGINDTMVAAAAEAAASVPQGETGKAAESIVVTQEATPVGRIAGRWGSKFWRFLFLEIGTRAHTVKVKSKKVMSDGDTMYGRRARIPAIVGGHYLRRAADHQYPTLARRIRWRFVRGAGK